MNRTREPKASGQPTFPVTVLVDSREQLSFTFQGIAADAQDGGSADGSVELKIETEVTCLSEGDYSLKGFCSPVPECGGGISLERKGHADLWGTIAQGRERFERELERLSHYKVAGIICEADWDTVKNHPPCHTDLKFKTVFRSVLGWQQKYPTIHWHFCPGRRFAEVLTFRILQMFWRKLEKERKEREREGMAEKKEGGTNVV